MESKHARLWHWALLACLGIGLVLVGKPSLAQLDSSLDEGQVRFIYGPAMRAPKMVAKFKDMRYLEKLSRNLSRDLNLPSTLTLVLATCGTVNAFYDPSRQRIVMCYELVNFIARDAARRHRLAQRIEAETLLRMSVIWMHEVGHALIDILKLPVIGGEEDAADQLAVLFLASLDNSIADRAILAAAAAQYRQGQRARLSKSIFADEHSLGQQRYFNMLCLLYGSNPMKHRSLLAGGFISRRQARRCPSRYEKVANSWVKLLDDRVSAGFIDAR